MILNIKRFFSFKFKKHTSINNEHYEMIEIVNSEVNSLIKNGDYEMIHKEIIDLEVNPLIKEQPITNESEYTKKVTVYELTSGKVVKKMVSYLDDIDDIKNMFAYCVKHKSDINICTVPIITLSSYLKLRKDVIFIQDYEQCIKYEIDLK
jgi:hypothetical protein